MDNNFFIRETPWEGIEHFTRFVISVFNQKAEKSKDWMNVDPKTIQEMLFEDRLHYPNAHFLKLLNKSGDLVGTAKVTLRNDGIQFPYETFFGIDLDKHLENTDQDIHEVWHFGRLAIRPGMASIKALNALIFHSIEIAAKNPKNIVISECDVALYHKLNLLGMKINKMGQARNYVGSPTIPIIITAKDLVAYKKKMINAILA